MSNSTMRLLIFILACWAPYINALHASAASAGVSFTNDAYGQMQHAPNTQYAASKTLRNRRMYAMCPPHFQRVGSECYSLLPQASSWLEAHFFCKDKNAKLAEPQNRADRKLRTFLKQYDAQSGLTGPIWIGATYDWQSNVWQWSISGKNLTYDAFSRMEPEQNLENHCAVFDPNLDYRWSARPCPDKFRFICQHKMPKVSEKNRGKVYTRWNATYPNEYANEVILEVMDQPDRNGHRSNVVVKAEGSDEQILLPKTRSKGGRNRDRQGRRPSNRPISRMTTLHPNDIASQASTNSPTTAVPYNEIAVPITRMSNATNKIIRVQRPRNRGQTPHDRVVWRQRQKEKRRLQRKRERSQRMQQEKEQRLAEQRRLLQENQQRLQQERERERQQQQQQQQQEQEQEQQDQQQKSHEQTEQPPKRELDELRQREAIDQERQRQQQIQQAEADTKRREYEEHHRELEALKKQLAEEKQRREDEYTSAERIRQERIGRQRDREEKERRERKEALRKAEEERAKEEAKREKERLEMEKRQREEYEERLKQAQDERERQLHEQQERKRLEDEANRLRLEEEEKQRQEEIKRQLEEEEKRLELQRLEETRKLERQELDRLAEENRRRKELILKRQEEIARREEEERNILEEEERIKKELEETEKRHKEEHEAQIRQEEEALKAREEAERRATEEAERLRQERYEALKKQEDERIRLEKKRQYAERLSRLSPEDQRKFFEMRKRRKSKKTQEQLKQKLAGGNEAFVEE
ncbi:trichohyalin isoform X2 [Ceratitis capitata]|uniref:trichohyalin isoform X2 n=1 Tax=Ceratitis capitata TaxID=7213 RepID=UPI000329E477|nr:trichohyalin isoform X2 [Ceratitis capitata]